MAQCALDQFIMWYDYASPKLCVYNSSMHRLRNVACKRYSAICCNSKFVFCLFDKTSHSELSNSYEPGGSDYENVYISHDEDDDVEYEQEEEEEEECSTQRIQARHLDTLSKASFIFYVREKKYSIKQIVTDEHHVVALSCLDREPFNQWYMSIFDLQATRDEKIDGANSTAARRRKVYLAERFVRLDIESVWLSSVFLLDGWLLFHLNNELVWIDKEGARSETRTEWDSKKLNGIFASGSSLILTQRNGKLLLKR